MANIHSFESLAAVDGEGIRFDVFFTGCPLRCAYCHNPDTWHKGDIEMSAREVFEKARRYKPYFKNGGGVTFSGGECMTHSDFLAQTLALLKENGIHTTVDTCGAVPTQNFCEVEAYTDLFLYDLKKMDPELHKSYTGMDNRLILQNLEYLCGRGANIIIRIPLIPGYTDSPADIQAIGAYIRDVLKNRIVRCELLPYNKLAASKYGNKTIWNDYTLGDYPLPELEPQSADTLRQLRGILEDCGVTVYAEKL